VYQGKRQLNLIWRFQFKLDPIFSLWPICLKNTIRFNNVQQNLSTFFQSKSQIHLVEDCCLRKDVLKDRWASIYLTHLNWQIMNRHFFSVDTNPKMQTRKLTFQTDLLSSHYSNNPKLTKNSVIRNLLRKKNCLSKLIFFRFIVMK
jgi:hypothetical protein